MEGDPLIGRTPDAHRVSVPDKLVRGLIAATAEMADARRRRDELVVEALRMGCSTREVAAASGLTKSRVQQIGNEHGWPPPELAEARRQERAARAADREKWERFRAERESQRPPD